MRVEQGDRLHSMDFREFGISALFAAVVLFVAAMVMLNENLAQVRRGFDMLERAHAVQKRIDDVNNLTNNVEMTVRGHALTGDAKFVERHGRTKARLDAAIADLHALLAGQDEFRNDLRELDRAETEHATLYDTLIGVGPAQQAVVAEAIGNPAKRHFKERVIDALTRLETTELNRLGAQRAAAEHKARVTYAIAIGVAALAFLSGTLGFALTLFGRRRPQPAGGRP